MNKVGLMVVPPINTDQALRNNQIEAGNLGGVFKDVAPKQGGLHVRSSGLGQLKPGLDVNNLFTNEYNPYANGTYPPDSGESGKNA